MQNVLQQNIQEISFKFAIEREELMIKKYKHYSSFIKDNNLKDLLTEFETSSREQISLFIEKMEKLNPKGSLKR